MGLDIIGGIKGLFGGNSNSSKSQPTATATGTQNSLQVAMQNPNGATTTVAGNGENGIKAVQKIAGDMFQSAVGNTNAKDVASKPSTTPPASTGLGASNTKPPTTGQGFAGMA